MVQWNEYWKIKLNSLVPGELCKYKQWLNPWVSYSNKNPLQAHWVSIIQILLLPAVVLISIGTLDIFPGYLEVHKHIKWSNQGIFIKHPESTWCYNFPSLTLPDKPSLRNSQYPQHLVIYMKSLLAYFKPGYDKPRVLTYRFLTLVFHKFPIVHEAVGHWI